MKTRLGGGGGGRRRDRGCPVGLHGLTVADKDKTRTAIRKRGRPRSETSLFPSLAKSQQMLENQWPSMWARGVVAARGGVGVKHK